jgi:hypothetical protein
MTIGKIQVTHVDIKLSEHVWLLEYPSSGTVKANNLKVFGSEKTNVPK